MAAYAADRKDGVEEPVFEHGLVMRLPSRTSKDDQRVDQPGSAAIAAAPATFVNVRHGA